MRTLDEVRWLPTLRTQVKHELKALTKHTKQMLSERTEVRQELKALKKQIKKQGIAKQVELARIVARVEQSQAVYKSDTGPTRPLKTALEQIDNERVPAHVRAVVAAAPLESDPCPHIVLDDLLPDDA